MGACNFYNQAGNGFDLWVTDDDGAEFLTARDVADALEDVERESRSLWGLTRSRAIREYNAERRRINKKILPMLADRLGFFKIRMIGRFSNGSAVYERARD